MVGFDGLPLGELVEPALTTVLVDIRLLGERTVATAAELFAGRPIQPAMLTPVLRVGASG
nr:hypothetical protein OH826_17070 [Streptomyces sp. NBC_00899]